MNRMGSGSLLQHPRRTHSLSPLFPSSPSLSLTLLLLLAFTPHQAHAGLYESDPSILELNTSSFEPAVLHSSSAWLVQFYASWCGHCQNFAPTWRALAEQMRAWEPYVRTAVADCARKGNEKLCQDYQIEGTPTLLVFPPGAGPANRSQIKTSDFNVNAIAGEMALVASRMPHAAALFRPLSISQILAKVETKKGSAHVVVVAIEPKTGSLSPSFARLILDNSKSKDASFHFLELQASPSSLPSAWGITSLPAIVAIDPDGRTAPLPRLYSETKRVLASFIKEGTPSAPAAEAQKKTGLRPTALAAPVFPHVHMQDLIEAISYSLRHEVAMRHLDAEAVGVLSGYVRLLYACMQDTPLGPAISQIIDFIDDNSNLDTAGWQDFMRTWLLPGEGEEGKQQWIQCAGSAPNFRGYPCGLWSLLHVLTVAMDTGAMEPVAILHIARDYIRVFFQCRVCAKHFLTMAENIAADIQKPKPGDAILWLWRAHNKANIRLRDTKSLSNDPLYPKAPFPSALQCPSCRVVDEPSADAGWDRVAVLAFLRSYYSLDPHADRSNGIGNHHHGNVDNNSILPVSPAMVSFCLALNLVTVVALLVMFLVRRRRARAGAGKLASML